MGLVKRAIRGMVRRLGYDIVPRQPQAPQPPRRYPQDFSPDDIAIIEQALPYTMTGGERLHAMIQATRYISQHQIAGAVVECGVWRGGSMMAGALTLRRLGDDQRDLYLYDTFQGMSAPTERDVHNSGIPAAAKYEATRTADGGSTWCMAGLEQVQAALQLTGYDPARIHYVQGKVEDTIPATLPDRIALLRLDTDWYESTRHELEHLFPRLASRGVLIIDDYFDWKGQRQAVDEYLRTHPLPMFLHRVDFSARIAIKP